MGVLEQVGASLMGSRRIGGAHSGSLSMATAGIKVDAKELKLLRSEFDLIRSTVESLRKEMDKLSVSSARAVGAARGAGAGTGGAARAQNGMPTFAGGFTSLPIIPAGGGTAAATAAATGGGGAAGGGGGGLFGRGGGMGVSGALIGGMIAGQVGSRIMGAVDRRIDRGMDYASNLDRLNIVMQQQTGMSQLQVMNQVRKPLANYRLGPDGINSLVGFQTQYGVGINPQYAQSVAGIRALSGYTKSTEAVLQDQTSLMDPSVANRMFNMLGVNAYKMGGGFNDPMKMRQQIVQTMGLTSSFALKGAKTPGSVTRARMTDAGIPVEVQDEILSYAQSNLTFKQKGGKGMYDPSKKEDMKRMGIEENFATQQEETDRLKVAREEQFSRRQIDNMATLERSNQSLIKALGSLEDKISGLIGARTSGRSWMKIGGGLLSAAGAAATFVNPAVGITMMAGGGLLSGSGDPPEGGSRSAETVTTTRSDSSRDASITIPSGYGGKRASLNAVKQRSDFKSLNPKMQDRLLSMFRANPNVGLGTGSRSTQAQETMFRSRYRKTSSKTNIFWDGSYWEHVSGAAAAPPGRSMHEIGLAADLVGDLKWMNANASRFGLKHFAGVNSEPWHVQPSELPNSRREYEGGGASWGSDGSFAESPEGITTGEEESAHPSGGSIGGMSMRDFSGMSIKDIVSVMREDGFGPGYRDNSTKKKKATGGASSEQTTVTGAGVLAGTQVARFAHGAGFRKQDLINMVAIAKRESGWRPGAHADRPGTKDNSYGLWQINMLGQLGVERLKQFGISNYEQLFDPATNAHAAHVLYERSGNQLTPWGGYKGKSNTYNADQYIAEATKAVQDAGLGGGDPMTTTMGAMPDRPHKATSGSTVINNAPTFQVTVSPQITFVGTPSSPDLKKIASEVTTLIQEQVRTLEMRSA